MEEQPGENLDGGLTHNASLELSVGSIASSPKASVAMGDLADHTDDNLFSNLDRKKIDSVSWGMGKATGRGFLSTAPSVIVCIANRVASPTFAMAPLKDIVKERVSSSEDTAFLVEVPVYVQAHQLPKLETDCVSVDKLLPILRRTGESLHSIYVNHREHDEYGYFCEKYVGRNGHLAKRQKHAETKHCGDAKENRQHHLEAVLRAARRAGTAPSGAC